MTWRVDWTRAAAKQLIKIPKKQRVLIASWVARNLDGCDDPRRVTGGRRLEGTDGGWRWRVGAYRVLGRLEDDRLVIEVVRVGHRQGVYKSLPRL